MQQEVVLAMLAKEPSYGYQLRARLRDTLGPLGEALNAGHVYGALPHRQGWPTPHHRRHPAARAAPPAA